MIDLLTYPVPEAPTTQSTPTLPLPEKPKGTPKKILREWTSDELRTRYWTLWGLTHPYWGIPVSWRAIHPYRSEYDKQLRRVQKREMERIERIIRRERGETLRAGEKFEAIFGRSTDVQATA